ncbi:NlpC/P60 family protein, partial [Kibdelosporangium lantanae]
TTGYDQIGFAGHDSMAMLLGVFMVSIQQSTVGQVVSRADVRAGDMIFFFNPVHHVAMAIDNKRAIHAPDVGQKIKVSTIDNIGPITVIRRVMN